MVDKREDKRYLCRMSVKIRLPVWDEEKDTVEILGTAVNISNQGLALEVIDNHPSKSRYSSLLWERILCQEMVSLELLREAKDSPILINGVMTWNSAGDLDTDFNDFSSKEAVEPRKYQVGFRFNQTEETTIKKINSLISHICNNNVHALKKK